MYIYLFSLYYERHNANVVVCALFSLILALPSRLLDVCAKLKRHGGMELGLVFEFVDQDLTSYLSKAPRTGLDMDKIKV